jgi:hypothetical protein
MLTYMEKLIYLGVAYLKCARPQQWGAPEACAMTANKGAGQGADRGAPSGCEASGGVPLSRYAAGQVGAGYTDHGLRRQSAVGDWSRSAPAVTLEEDRPRLPWGPLSQSPSVHPLISTSHDSSSKRRGQKANGLPPFPLCPPFCSSCHCSAVVRSTTELPGDPGPGSNPAPGKWDS